MIQSIMKEIHVIPIHYVSLEFLWNDYFNLVNCKFDSIHVSTKRTLLIFSPCKFSYRLVSFCWYWSVVFKAIVNVPSYSSLLSYSSDIFFIVYANSFVVCWFSILGNHDKSSAAIFLYLCIYYISGTYSSIINLHCNTRSVLKFLHIIFLWSAYILNF